MSFDMEPDHDEHAECRHEIEQLRDKNERLRSYKAKTEAWKGEIFKLLQCGSNGRVLEEIGRLQKQCASGK